MKTCSRCKVSYELTEFRKSSKNRDGLQNWCRHCFREYDRQRWNNKTLFEKERKNNNKRKRWQRQRGIIDQIKLTSGCVDCGYKEHAVALDFDHVNGNKSFNIGEAANRGLSDQTLFDEIAKCVVRCSNCHRVATHARRNGV